MDFEELIPPHPSTPRVVNWLGYGGLVPFAVLTVLNAAGTPSPLLAHALLAYGAVILSFVGALHWGFAMTLPGLTEASRTWMFIWSTVPALVAWPALLAGPGLATVLVVAGFIAHYLQDRRLAKQASLPHWYLPLRLRLSVVASGCMLTLLR